MYKNPLNNGDISDYNSLKKQRDNAATVKKYENKKLQTKPNELQKYYQYLTYQQPILDELNYVAERMRTEDIKTKTDDYNFIEDLKIKRENQMKETSNKEGEDIARDTLFDKSSTVKEDDDTPVINTDVELEYPKIEVIQKEMKNELIAQAKADLGFDNDDFSGLGGLGGLFDEVLTSSDNNKKDIFELSNTDIEKENKRIAKEAEKEAEKAAKKAAKAAEKEAKKPAEAKKKASKGKKGKMGSKGKK
jgi:hypothetical protein